MASPPPGHARLVTFMTLDPGHFHAALLHKTMYEQVSPLVYIYAPDGPDVDEHLARIDRFNTRAEQPTHWQCQVYTGPDYLDTLLTQAPGNVVIVAGINSRKMTYVQAAVRAGINVLADKPMCIDPAGWAMLKEVVEMAQRRRVILTDIMTGRHEITTILLKELRRSPAVFGTLQHGTLEQPAMVKESVHYLFKYVSGQPLKRPVWYFDVTQQGEGLVDVTTHLVDAVMWTSFPEQRLDYRTDVDVLQARRWPTMLTREQFAQITGTHEFPEALHGDLDARGVLPYSCNGDMHFTLKGVHTSVRVSWQFEAPAGSGDTHMAATRGTRSTLFIRQGEAERYVPELYVEPAAGIEAAEIETALRQTLATLQHRYPGVGLQRQGSQWHVRIPDRYRIGHEAHFGKVAETYLRHVQEGALPEWELPNLLTKYHITTQALALARAEAEGSA